MRRQIGSRTYLHLQLHSLDAGDDLTVLMPLCCMVRVKCVTVASGATLLYRNVGELASIGGGADPADTAALDADYCDVLSETVTDSGWIDVQPSGMRFEAVAGTVDFVVQWNSELKPVVA